MSDDTKPTKILIVEDEPIIAEITCGVLKKLGYHADLAINGKEALEKSVNSYDLILMDIGLPDISGIEIAAQIRFRKSSYIPIIAFTAYTDQKLKNKCIAVGIEEIINKPATTEQLQQALQKYCGNAAKVNY